MAARRPRSGNLLSVKQALVEVDSFLTYLDPALRSDADQTPQALDLTVVYTFVSPGPPTKRLEVTRAMLEGADGDEWPLPGIYEIDVVDSNNDSVLGGSVWRAEHLDKELLKKQAEGRQDGVTGSTGQLISTLQEEARMTVAQQRAAINRAESDLIRAKTALAAQLDVSGELQKKLGVLQAERDRAVAEAELAKSREAEWKLAYDELEEDTSKFKPHVSFAVDRAIEHGKALLGMGDAPSPIPDPEAQEMPAVSVSQMPVSEEGETAAAPEGVPPGANNTSAIREAINRIMVATIFDPSLCRSLVEGGEIEWADVRVAGWIQFGVDFGEEPDWAEFEAWYASWHDAAPDAEGGA